MLFVTEGVNIMKEISTSERMLNYIKRNPKSRVYSISDFSKFGTYASIRKALSRLEMEGRLIRVSRGFYKSSEFNKLINEETSSDPDQFARAYAEAYGWKIAPHKETALNMLGLSTQVPSVFQYISDGPYRTVSLSDGRKIEFRHRTIREISKLSYKEAALLEALKTLGKERISPDVRSKILRRFRKRELEALRKRARKSRKWVYEEICKWIERSGNSVSHR